MKITELLRPEGVRLGMRARTRDEAIDQLTEMQVASGAVTDAAGYKEAVLERESTFSTAVGEGIAIPHAKTAAAAQPGLVAATLDKGVAKLVKMGVEGGHAGNPDIVCGVCGETGGDPESIHMYYDLGLDYVSCSPYRVPIARLAAAQAKIEANGGAEKVAK